MKLIASIIAVAMLIAIQSTQADADILIYRVSGVTDDGGADNTGVATALHCTNSSGVQQSVNVSFKFATGAPVNGFGAALKAGETRTWATHPSVLFEETGGFGGGVAIHQGSAAISASSDRIHCSAMVIDAGASVPHGFALHMVRYSPVPNTQE
jgi:hypothetical protein